MKIPIANVYYLLSYAWWHVKEPEVVDVDELEGLDHVQDLLGLLLAEGTHQVVRRGLGRDYREVVEDLAGIRGKLDVSQMAKRALRARGRASCVFEELSHDVAHNQILRSTLWSLLRLPDLDQKVRAKVRNAYQKLDGIQLIRVDRHAFRQVQLDRNRRVYRFLLSICYLVHENLLVNEQGGETRFRDFRDDYQRMWELFENFVKEFYAREQCRYDVNRGGRKIEWMDATGRTDRDRALIPGMHADVILEAPDRRIILDAKFYGEAFSNRFDRRRLHSDNLYQLLAYLRNREATARPGPMHQGVLLYPVVTEPIAADVQLEGFRIHVRGIDLSQDWRRIRRDMLAVVGAG